MKKTDRVCEQEGAKLDIQNVAEGGWSLRLGGQAENGREADKAPDRKRRLPDQSNQICLKMGPVQTATNQASWTTSLQLHELHPSLCAPHGIQRDHDTAAQTPLHLSFCHRTSTRPLRYPPPRTSARKPTFKTAIPPSSRPLRYPPPRTPARKPTFKNAIPSSSPA